MGHLYYNLFSQGPGTIREEDVDRLQKLEGVDFCWETVLAGRDPAATYMNSQWLGLHAWTIFEHDQDSLNPRMDERGALKFVFRSLNY